MTSARPQFQTINLSLFALEGQVAVVTGASRGIGASLAGALDRAGCRVALVARNETQLKEVAKALHNEPLVVPADIGHPDAAGFAIAEIENAAGRVDILVNNAGIANLGPAHRLDVASWDEVSNVNLRAAFLFAQAAGKGMCERGSGKIVNVSSVVAFASDAYAVAYTATKAGMIGLTKALAVEWARKGVQVNALCPGWVDTDMTRELRGNEAFEQRVLGSVPQMRWGAPEDLDGPLVFLCSAASNFMTGQALIVDGGLLSRW